MSAPLKQGQTASGLYGTILANTVPGDEDGSMEMVLSQLEACEGRLSLVEEEQQGLRAQEAAVLAQLSALRLSIAGLSSSGVNGASAGIRRVQQRHVRLAHLIVPAAVCQTRLPARCLCSSLP